MPLPLRTERLRLRPAASEDLETWLAISRDAETVWWGEPSSTLEDARANLERQIANQERHGFSLWAVELDGAVIGAIYLQRLGEGPEIEVGYRYLREHWGQRYATEAARAA